MSPILSLLLAALPQGSPTLDWIDVYNGPPGDQGDGAEVVLTDDAGRVFAGGFSLGTLANGNHTSDVFVRAYDESGNVLWSYRYDGGAQDMTHAMTLAADGDVIVAGVRDKYSSAWGEDWVIIRLDPATGQARWVTVYDGPSAYNDRPAAVAVNSAGEIIVAGETGDNFGANDTRITVAAFDGAGGALLWDTHEIGPWIGSDYASDMVLDAQDNVWVAASSSTQSDGLDMALYVFDAGGTKLWSRLHGQSGFSPDRGLGVAVDAAGNGYLAGTVWDAADGDVIHVRSYDAAGNLRWERTRSSAGLDGDWPAETAMASNGDVLVGGHVTPSSGREGVLLRLAASNGAILQDVQVGSTSGARTSFLAMAPSPDGAVYLTGSVGFGTAMITARVGAGGTVDWVLEQGDVNGVGEPIGRDVALGPTTGTYVVGDAFDSQTWFDWFAERIDDGRRAGLVLSVSPLQRGQTADFALSGAEPLRQASFLYSFAGTGSGPCPPILNGECLGILAPVNVLATLTTNAAGEATFLATVPPNAPTVPVHFQAAVPATADPVSNVVTQVIQ